MKLALISLAVGSGSPPLGLCSIATYLEKYANFKDTVILNRNFEDVYARLSEIKPDVVGITAMTIYYPEAVKMAKKVKEMFDVPVLIGGNHVSTIPDSLQRCFDIGVIGEAEETMKELVELYIEKGKFLNSDLHNVKGILFFEGDKLIRTEMRPVIFPLDKIPIPNRDYLNKKCFERVLNYSSREFDICYRIHASRGCPYRCKFCSPSIMWGTKVRLNSVDRIVEEIKIALEKYHATYISFSDDLFTVSKDRLRELYEKLDKAELLGKVKFAGRVRANLVDDEMCELLKKLGFVSASLGYESGNDEILRFLKGGSVTVKDNYNTVRLLEKYKITNYGSFIFGSPNESLDQMRDTLNLIKYAYKHGIGQIYVYLLQPFPGTEAWDIAKEKGLVSDDMDWEKLSLFLEDINENHKPILMDKGVDFVEFKKIYDEALSYSRKLSRKRFMMIFFKHPIKTVMSMGNPFSFIKKNLAKKDKLDVLREKKKI